MTKLAHELAKLIEVRAVPIPCDQHGRVVVRLECNVQPALDMISAIQEALDEWR